MNSYLPTAIIISATLLLAFSHSTSASDLGLEDRKQIGERGAPQCFESNDRTERAMRHLTRGGRTQRTQDFADFRQEHGLDARDDIQVTLLEDPGDTDICRELGEKHLDAILEPHEGDRDTYGNVYANDAAFFRMEEYYVLTIASAWPIAAEHRERARVQTGMVSYQFAVYDRELDEIWSLDIAL